MLKNKKEIVNYGILVKFLISNISNFLEKIIIILQNSLIKSWIHTIKNTKILRIFWWL